jgi:tRNA(adenine34) deaminase
MNRTIEIAHGNPDAPFGCVVVDRETGEILAEGLNRAERNPVLHGEISALLGLTDSRAGEDPHRLVLYSTAEPCPICSGAIL